MKSTAKEENKESENTLWVEMEYSLSTELNMFIERRRKIAKNFS